MTWEEICPAFSLEYDIFGCDMIFSINAKENLRIFFFFAILALFIAVSAFGLSVFSMNAANQGKLVSEKSMVPPLLKL